MKTFYRSEMNVSTNGSFSPSAGKPKAFIEYLKARGHELDIVSDFKPASILELQLAHDSEMVTNILQLKKNNGFGNRSEEVARSLPYTTGSMMAAAEYALLHKVNTFSPTSGFHHARYNSCGGFCTFNGLMVTAIKLMLKNKAKIGILDLDMHYGDGTEDIIRMKGLKNIVHYTFGGDDVSRRTSTKWINGLFDVLDKFKDCDIVLYQAGGDPHIDDPLGGVLSSAHMAKRDEIVFNVLKGMKIPVAWNLAGGYQNPLEKVLELHETTYTMAKEIA